MEPAASIIRKLGGPSVVARIAGVHRTRVSNWMRSKESGGTGGRIPQDHHRAILNAGAQLDPPISAEDLLPAEQMFASPAPSDQEAVVS